MSLRKNIIVKSFTASLLMILMLAMGLTINAQTKTKIETEAEAFAAKHPTRVDVYAKILNLDPIKGDVTLRLEFFPDGDLLKEGVLTKNIKFDTESANGKSEITFEKGKKMHATEVILSMYGETKEGSNYVSKVEDYPFDTHQTDLYLYFYTKPDKKKEAPKPAETDGANPVKEEAVEEEEEIEVPHFLVFNLQDNLPKASGYEITTTKSKDSDDGLTELNLKMSRSLGVKLFATFIMLLMLGVSFAVAALVFTVVILGRKSEIAMFSFITTLLFAFVTVRNSQPGVPPVGTFSDILSFFWAEGILGVCLLAVVLTWVFRKPA